MVPEPQMQQGRGWHDWLGVGEGVVGCSTRHVESKKAEDGVSDLQGDIACSRMCMHVCALCVCVCACMVVSTPHSNICAKGTLLCGTSAAPALQAARHGSAAAYSPGQRQRRRRVGPASRIVFASACVCSRVCVYFRCE